MDSSLYTNLGKRVREPVPGLKEVQTLKELNKNHHNNWDEVSVSEISRVFCNDLRALLEHGEISLIIHDLFIIESQLHHLHEAYPDKTAELPHLEDLYRGLSPVLLRSLWEHSELPEGESDVIRGWIEALRISIEEEIYLWQEKFEA
ncbi:MAG: hypothetical protein HN509_10085 [Halobacteriovoraceae bacterium]|jgi:hypothetical protein|nr:hypothetical protein [Halobacteriovoraceae bacterium]MBT5095814.1 hypothetical protein [Halobacteriovoraceae bacterium]